MTQLRVFREPMSGLRQPRPASSSSAAIRLRICLLGPMRLEDGAGREITLREKKSRALLAILALTAPRPISRDRLIGLLWSRRGRPQALASLRQSVHHLQGSLQPIADGILRSERNYLALGQDGLWVDIAALPAAHQTERAALMRGPFLNDLIGLDPEFDRWIEAQRQRLAGFARLAGDPLMMHATGPENPERLGLHVGVDDPSTEDAWQSLINGYLQQGGDRSMEKPDLEEAEMPALLMPEAEARLLVETMLPPPEPMRQSPGSGMRLGVLPLRPLHGTAEDPLAVGLAEEITTALSRFRGVSCMASSSLARIGGVAESHDVLWRTLALDFILDGTLQRFGSRVRINMRLLDVRAGEEVVWAHRFDRDSTDLLSLQDDIAAETVGQLDPKLLLREGIRVGNRPIADPNAYELTLQAIPAVYRLDRAGYSRAGDLLAAAVEQDPHYASAYAWWAYWHLLLVGQGWANEPEADMARAEALAEQAIRLDGGDARALTIAGHVRAFLHRRAEDACALHDQALAINPNLALAWMFSGLAHVYAGRSEEALERAAQARRLSPLDPHGFMTDTAFMLPHLITGHFQACADVGRRATELSPTFTANLKVYLASLGHLGRKDEAATALQRLQRLEPGFTVSAAVSRSPLAREQDRAIYAEGLRLGGLPD